MLFYVSQEFIKLEIVVNCHRGFARRSITERSNTGLSESIACRGGCRSRMLALLGRRFIVFRRMVNAGLAGFV